MITYNGNEMMLQNDMGNTLIQDSATGNIMGLSPGFIPIGMKERGGIMYITSVDKEGNGEIGTIPSPIIRDFYKDKVTFEVNQSIPINIGNAIKISNKLYPADKFIANLQMEIEETSLVGKKFKKYSGLSSSPDNDPSDIILGRDVIRYTNELAEKQTLYTPVLSYNSNISEILLLGALKHTDLFSSKGIYSLELYSKHDNSSDIPANSLSSPLLYQDNTKLVESNYWYLHTSSPTNFFPKDLLTATLNKNLKQFPSNNKPGYLAVKLLTEGINKFDILPRKKDPFYTPITYKAIESGVAQYYTYFPGFYYSTDSGIYIDKIEARVIDESTAKEMKLVYPYSNTIPEFTVNNLGDDTPINNFLNNPELNNLFKNNNDTGHMYNAYEKKALPQVQSLSDNNSFILTTLKQITNHSKTEMESSTQNQDKTYGGVFCVPLGNKYNNWYRAEIDYYDLYNNRQGTFIKRFNPYLNDVFGTNLSVEDVEMAELVVMGSKNLMLEWRYEYDLTPITDCYAIHRFPELYGWADDYTNTKGKVLMRINKENKANYEHTFYLSDYVLPSITVIPSIPSDNYEYLYADKRRDVTYTWNIPTPKVAVTLQVLSMSGLYGMDDSTGHKGKYSNYLLFGGDINVTSEQGHDRILLAGAELSSANIVGTIASVGFKDFLYNNKTTNFLDAPFYISSAHSDTSIFTTKILADPILMHTVGNTTGSLEQTNFGDHISIPLNISILDSVHSGFGLLFLLNDSNPYSPAGPNAFPNLFWVILSKNDNEWYDAHFEVKSDIRVLWEDQQKWTLKLSKKSNPSYSITPYFCLTGTNDEGKKTYVSRFKKGINMELTYLCNFETDNLGNILNYITDNSEKKNGKIVCSYNHSYPFMYNDTDFSETIMLLAGIYVLNIARCPGETALGDIGTLGPLIDFTIVLNGITYKYSELTQELLQESGFSNDDTNRWVTLPMLKFPNKTIKHRHIYKPLVLIVKSNQSINLNIEGMNYTDWEGIELGKQKFIRQSIGLYKLKNIDKSGILQDLKFLNSNLYTYNEYMKKLNDCFKNLNDILYYNQMQKYGVFFKSAYVFIDGLTFNNPTQIKNVTVVKTTYNTYPYIPSDPSILPVELDSNYNYIWNAYAMPKEIITTPDEDHEFVFSNGVPLEVPISTKADLNNLRKPV